MNRKLCLLFDAGNDKNPLLTISNVCSIMIIQPDMIIGSIMGTEDNKNVDMICQHKADGSIIPIKLRMTDDDGAYQEYKIHAYKDLSYKGSTFDLPDVSSLHSTGILPFECIVESFGCRRTLRLFYNSYDHTWKLANRS